MSNVQRNFPNNSAATIQPIQSLESSFLNPFRQSTIHAARGASGSVADILDEDEERGGDQDLVQQLRT